MLETKAVAAINENKYVELAEILPELFKKKRLKRCSGLGSTTIYHGITPKTPTYTRQEMPNPSEMITPTEYVDLLEKILEEGLKGSHNEFHPLTISDEFPPVYFTTTMSGTHAHMGVYMKAGKTPLFTSASHHEVVVFAKQFKPEIDFGIYVKTWDYLEADYDGGRADFQVLGPKEQNILRDHVNGTMNELERRSIDYKLMVLGENTLMDRDYLDWEY